MAYSQRSRRNNTQRRMDSVQTRYVPFSYDMYNNVMPSKTFSQREVQQRHIPLRITPLFPTQSPPSEEREEVCYFPRAQFAKKAVENKKAPSRPQLHISVEELFGKRDNHSKIDRSIWAALPAQSPVGHERSEASKSQQKHEPLVRRASSWPRQFEDEIETHIFPQLDKAPVLKNGVTNDLAAWLGPELEACLLDLYGTCPQGDACFYIHAKN